MKFKQTGQSVTLVGDYYPLGATPSGAIIFEVVSIPREALPKMRNYWLPLGEENFSFDWADIKEKVS